MDKIRDKISKLLALAKSPNKAEAIAAMSKAQELSLKYGIELEQIEVPEVVEQRFILAKKLMSYHINAICSLAKANNCVLSRIMGEPVVVIYGKKQDVETTIDTYQYYMGILPRLFNNYYERQLLAGSIIIRMKKGRSATGLLRELRNKMVESYSAGFMEEFARESEAIKENIKAETGLILLVPEKAIDLRKSHTNGKETTHTTSIHDYSAFKQGMKDGSNYKGQAQIENSMDSCLCRNDEAGA